MNNGTATMNEQIAYNLAKGSKRKREDDAKKKKKDKSKSRKKKKDKDDSDSSTSSCSPGVLASTFLEKVLGTL